MAMKPLVSDEGSVGEEHSESASGEVSDEHDYCSAISRERHAKLRITYKRSNRRKEEIIDHFSAVLEETRMLLHERNS